MWIIFFLMFLDIQKFQLVPEHNWLIQLDMLSGFWDLLRYHNNCVAFTTAASNKSLPWPFWGLFLLPPPRICSHVPIKGRGVWYIPNRGAPWPSYFPVLLPNLGAPLPVIFLTSSIANGIPELIKIVPRPLPSCVLGGFIWTPEPVWRTSRISCFFFRIEGVYMQSTDWFYSDGLKTSYLPSRDLF